MYLDFHTLLMVSALSYLAHGLSVLVIWRYHRTIPGLRQWAGHYLLVSIGLLLVLLAPALPNLLVMVGGNLAQCLGYLALLDGLRRFFGKRGLEVRHYLLFILIVGGLFLLLSFIWPSLPARAISHYLLGTMLYAAMAVQLNRPAQVARISPQDEGPSAILLPQYLCIFQALFMAGMALYWIAAPTMEGMAEAQSLYVLVMLDAMLVSLLLLVALGLMVAERYHQALTEQAVRDPLTGLYNRRGFDELALHDLRRRLGEDEHLFVAIADLDNFKRLNDAYGHTVGDEALRCVARQLSLNVREGDLVGRYGGEEFYFLLNGIDDVTAASVLERCRAAVANQPVMTAAGELNVTISIGYSRRRCHQEPFASLLSRADDALYRAKLTGKNRICLAEN